MTRQRLFPILIFLFLSVLSVKRSSYLPINEDTAGSSDQDGQVFLKEDLEFTPSSDHQPTESLLKTENVTPDRLPVLSPEEATTTGEEECPAHSINICPTKCDPSCKKPLVASFQCPISTSCVKKTCVCLNGYVWDDMTRKCILPQYCPERCRENEVFRICPSACLIHCGNYKTLNSSTDCPEDSRDDYECEASCVCRQGFIRDLVSKKCIDSTNCPPIVPGVIGGGYPCPENEHFEECADCSQSIKYCHGPDQSKGFKNLSGITEQNCSIPTTGKVPCRSGCFCDEGFIRLNTNAKCIPQNDCSVMLKYVKFKDD